MITPEQQIIVDKYRAIEQEALIVAAKFEDQLDGVCEEYTNYVEHYQEYYDDDPLSIAEWFTASNRWEELMEEFNQRNKDCHCLEEYPFVCECGLDEWEHKTEPEFRRLERVLGA